MSIILRDWAQKILQALLLQEIMSTQSFWKEWRRENFMKNTLLTKLRQKYHKNPYVKTSFPYNMRDAIKYAESKGKRVYQLTDDELNLFLLPKNKRLY